MLQNQSDLTIDQVSKYGYELYGPKGLTKWAKQINLNFIDLGQLENSNSKNFSGYPTTAEIESQLKRLQDKYPEILHLISIGKSVDGKELYFMKISDNPEIDEVEPEVKYIANMHGNEIVGRELMVKLIEDLAISYTNADQRIRQLVDNTEIYIMPTMNPDGSDKKRRGNSRWVDLNRDFPDFTTTDNQNNYNNRAPETVAVMKFQDSRNFCLSANFHGGAVVVNYPWDTTGDTPPLHDLIVDLSKEYASQVPGMYNSTRFAGGITNGYDWYHINGGMQDWSYNWYDDLQVTIELSDNKWPSYSEIPKFYTSNKASLIRYLERIHQGAGFTISKSLSGEVTINKISSQSNSKTLVGRYHFRNGEYYKVLEAGLYEFAISTTSGNDLSFNTTVKKDTTSIRGNYTRL
ncbi:MAG: succinylglutamate desuccinylase/aspartoacylase family protein [Bacteriovoracaceae bacterium]|nr:succinylglutamate desuccinylase/aspartoacylase family protein [Bacteriovoracaceae bacterium]